MIKGIGVDIVDLRRIAKHKDSLAKKILSVKEYTVYSNFTSSVRQIEYLGGRFAAKEAIFKAVSPSISFHDIEILNDTNGRPSVNLPDIHISLSHEKNYAVAYVIYEDSR